MNHIPVAAVGLRGVVPVVALVVVPVGGEQAVVVVDLGLDHALVVLTLGLQPLVLHVACGLGNGRVAGLLDGFGGGGGFGFTGVREPLIDGGETLCAAAEDPHEEEKR